MKMSAALTIRVVTSLEEFKGLAREWEELLDRVPGHSLFLTWEWLYYWATHHLEDGQLRILLASDEHECLVGNAPLYLRRTKAQGLISVRELRWLGSEAVCSSYLDFIVQERHKPALLQRLYRYLATKDEVSRRGRAGAFYSGHKSCGCRGGVRVGGCPPPTTMESSARRWRICG